MNHLSDDAIEQYAINTVPRFKLESVEEHLLFCPASLDRLIAHSALIQVMRVAAAKFSRLSGGRDVIRASIVSPAKPLDFVPLRGPNPRPDAQGSGMLRPTANSKPE